MISFIAGKYVYIETSSPRVRGDKARLISPQVTFTQPTCLQFYYHMYGAEVNTLNVYQMTGGVLPQVAIWTKSLNQGNRWIKGQTTIQGSQPFNVRTFMPCKLNISSSDFCLFVPKTPP